MTAKNGALMRVVLVGDVGGQIGVFERVLSELGIDPHRPVVPDGTLVIQVGDVVRASSSDELDSVLCEALADELLRLNPAGYIQLLGNHDLAAIGGPGRPGWVRTGFGGEIVRRWWSQREAKLAVALTDERGEQILVTHAGLTLGYWTRLGRPDAADAARMLNSLVGAELSGVLQPGRLVRGPANTGADVVWAEVCLELLEPWIESAEVPFLQIHGHASPWSWELGTWSEDASPRVRAATRVQSPVRRTVTDVGALPTGGRAWFESVDWALGDRRETRTWPLRSLAVHSSGVVV